MRTFVQRKIKLGDRITLNTGKSLYWNSYLIAHEGERRPGHIPAAWLRDDIPMKLVVRDSEIIIALLK